MLTARQEEARTLLAGPQRHTCLVGGARSGKTFLLVRQVMVRGIKAGGSRHAMLRYRGNAARASLWLDTLPKVNRLCFPTVKLKPYRQDGFVELPNESQIWIGGLDEKERVEKILGQEFATLYLNECSQIPYSSVLIARTRLAQNVSGLALRAYYDLNPVGKGHWTNKLFGQGRDPHSGKPLAEPDQYKRLFLNPRDNLANLPAGFIAELEGLPERHRKRFLDGEYVDETDGALWTIEGIERSRCTPSEVPALKRVVVAVDPSGTKGEEETRSDSVGIVAAGLGVDGIVYVLDDETCQLPPAGWGRRAIDLWERRQADSIVAEINFGGEMVRYVIESSVPKRADGRPEYEVPVRVVTASRGKAVRAEPVSALYEKGLVRHVGTFAELEDQMLAFTAAGFTGEKSPDRVDALVWALTDLMVASGPPVFGTPVERFTFSLGRQ